MYFVEKTKNINFFKQFDYVLFCGVVILSVIGFIVLHSATRTMPDSGYVMKTQAAGLILGVLLAIVVSAVDYKDFKYFIYLFYGISILFLILVLMKGSGEEEWGSKSWLILPVIGISFQPSEIAKIAFVLIVSSFLEKLKEKVEINNILLLALLTGLPIALVMLQPDYGTAMVFVFMFFVMLFIYGIKYRYIFMGLGVAALAAPLMWFFVLNDRRKERIISFLNPSGDTQGSGWQVMKSKMAIGAGKIFGQGLYDGIQTQRSGGEGIPVKDSDFIFAVIGEELGFVGAAAVILLIFIILFRCIYIAMSSRDLYGSLLVIGLTGMLGFHFFENIGMSVGVFPVTGIPLPFISKGANAMVTNYFAIGIILSVSLRRKKALFESD